MSWLNFFMKDFCLCKFYILQSKQMQQTFDKNSDTTQVILSAFSLR